MPSNQAYGVASGTSTAWDGDGESQSLSRFIPATAGMLKPERFFPPARGRRATTRHTPHLTPLALTGRDATRSIPAACLLRGSIPPSRIAGRRAALADSVAIPDESE